MQRASKILGLLGLALLGSLIFWSGVGSMLSLTLAVGMAIAGPGRRVAWAGAALPVFAALAIVWTYCAPYLAGAKHDLYFGILFCGLLPCVPGLLFWLAHRMRQGDSVTGQQRPGASKKRIGANTDELSRTATAKD